METLKKRLAEQQGRHQGGSKWIGTAGTSPFGAYGYNPQGVRIGQDGNRNFRAVKVWDQHDYKVIFVGDASMSPYELTVPGGAVEHVNPEPDALWLQRIAQVYPHAVWLNPLPPDYWGMTPSIDIIRQILSDRMYPLSLEGIDAAMRELVR